MTYLSSNQLKQYEDDGFVSPINIFSKEKAKEIRNEIELIENEMPDELEKSGRYNAHLISPLLDEVTHNSKILDAVESLIGENILVCGTTLFIKNPNEKGFVSPINIFSKDKAKEIRNEIELIENNMPKELENSGRYNAHFISTLLDEFTHNSKILDAVQS